MLNELTLQKAQAKLPGQTVDQRGNYPVDTTSRNGPLKDIKDSRILKYLIFNKSLLLTLYEKFSKM